MINQQGIISFQQINGKKITTTWNTIAKIIGHEQSICHTQNLAPNPYQ